MIPKHKKPHALLGSVLLFTFCGVAFAVSMPQTDHDEAQRLVQIMTSANKSWEVRNDAEQKLETLSSSAVLELLLPHVSKPMPEGGIYNSGGRKHDQHAPVPWQIYYASGRVWRHHSYNNKSVSSVLTNLLEKANTHIGKERILSAMSRCWGPDMEKPVTQLLLDPTEENSTRLAAASVLSYRDDFPRHFPTLLEQAKSVEVRRQNLWLQLLLSFRVKHKTGTAMSVVDLGFRQLQAQHKQTPYSIAAYATARRLELYVDQKFVPSNIEPNNARFNVVTVDNTLSWWRNKKNSAKGGNLPQN